MNAASSKPAAAAVVPGKPIPFREEPATLSGDPLGVFLALVAVLGVAVAGLWIARKKGWLDRWIAARALREGGGDVRVEQAVRLSPRSVLFSIRNGNQRVLLIESIANVSVVAVAPMTQEEGP